MSVSGVLPSLTRFLQIQSPGIGLIAFMVICKVGATAVVGNGSCIKLLCTCMA